MGKQQPLTDDREQLRQLTREAHEAAQDARAAIRELRAARAEFDKIADDKFDAMMVPRLEECAEYIRDERLRQVMMQVFEFRAKELGKQIYEGMRTGEIPTDYGIVTDLKPTTHPFAFRDQPIVASMQVEDR